MSDCPKSTRLLQAVIRRLKLRAVGRSAQLITLVLGAIYLVAFIASRGFGVLPNFFHPASVLAIPVVSLLLAVFVHHRPRAEEAAREIDRHAASKDLFLTLTLLESAGGQFQPLVCRDAERCSEQLFPEKIVPYRWENSRLRSVLLAGIPCLVAAVALMPQLDPFGQYAEAAKLEDQVTELERAKELTQERKAKLDSQADDGEISEGVRKALEGVAKTFGEMKRETPELNAEKLSDRQKQVAMKWRDLRNSDQLKELLNKNASAQHFGRAAEQMKKWGKQLEEGEPDELLQELQKMQEALQRLAKAEDPVERQKLQQELKKQMKQLDDFAREHVKSPQLRAALQRAKQQLEMAAENPEMASEALAAAMDSAELAKMELKEIAKTAKEMKKLEEAMKAIQQAKMLNSLNELQELADAATMEDYAQFYAELMGQRQGQGEGTGGEGQGRGGDVEEDADAETDYEKKKSRTSIDAGKVLLTIKTKGMSESGDVKQEYQKALNAVRSGLSEAIELEEIPPGYVPGIKNYFDAIADESAQE
ncbi:MAG: hypothetical protein ACYTGL_24255 [Planctomycetota bacterium]|jgi:hypothetical protein